MNGEKIREETITKHLKMFVFIFVWACMCVCMLRNQRVVLGIFLYHSLSFVLRQDLSLEP